MIKLSELNIWSKLSGPYDNSNEIPSLILKLSETFDKQIADEIIWEYIYHQGTRYQNTLATLPHLLEVIDISNDISFKLDLLISLGIVLVGIEPTNLNEIIVHNNLDQKTINRIKNAFSKALIDFKNKVINSFIHTQNLDEQEKRYFLATYLVAMRKHKEAEVFIKFSANDEYMFVCTNCQEETYLWNEEGILNAYTKDPVFYKEQSKIEINLNEGNSNLQYLENTINELDINSLKPLLKYFKGTIQCHSCSEKLNVFEGVINS